MERLTAYIGGYAHGKMGKTFDEAVRCDGYFRGKFEATAIVDKLAAYEDAGLSPAEVRELARAQAGGLAAPFKKGDTVFLVLGFFEKHFIREGVVEDLRYVGEWQVRVDDRYFRCGRRAFATRDEATRAMEEM